jgi:hypothetical protein
VTIQTNPFSYDVNPPFYAQVMFTSSNPNQSNTISLSIPDGQGGYLIKDVSITTNSPCTTNVLDVYAIYTLELTLGGVSAKPP